MDKININFSNQRQVNFKGDNDMKEPEKDFIGLFEYSIKDLRELFDDALSQNKFQKKVGNRFGILDTNNEAVLYIEKDEEEPQLKRFIVGVHNRHRDRLFSETMIKGTDEEIKKYLNDEDKKKEIFDAIKELSDKTDDFYSSL